MGNCVVTAPSAQDTVAPCPVVTTTSASATRSIYSYGLSSPEYIAAIYPKLRRQDFANDSIYATSALSREMAIDNHLDRCNGREVFDWY